MMKRLRFALLCAGLLGNALLLAQSANAQGSGPYVDTPGGRMSSAAQFFWNGTAWVAAGSGAGGTAFPVFDSNNAAFQGVTVITPGTPVTAARSLGFVLTTGCTETLTLADTSTIALALSASPSIQTLPFAVTNVSASTCVGTFWNLK